MAIFTSLQHEGRLSITSKFLEAVFSHPEDDGTGGVGIWKGLYETMAVTEYVRERNFPLGYCGRQIQTWAGERTMLTCFTDPDDKIIEKVGGYKQLAGCLLGKSCKKCGTISGDANPITFERICGDCSKDDESRYLIGKTKAKEAFLLTDKDLKALPGAEFASETFAGKSCKSAVHLMTDVKGASFKKFGGAKGLAKEIKKRKKAAKERYNKSQFTAKPQKKRSKVEGLSDRPADDLKDLRFMAGYNSGLPIGTAFTTPGQPGFQMTQSVGCSYFCSHLHNKKASSNSIIIMHQRLDHGEIMNLHPDARWIGYSYTSGDPNTDVPSDLVAVGEVPGSSAGLTGVFASASIEYKRYGGSYGNDGDTFCGEHELQMCTFSFGADDAAPRSTSDGVKIGVDYTCLYRRGVHDTSWDGTIDVCFQTGPNRPPILLLSLGLGGNATSTTNYEASAEYFTDLSNALGIANVEPAQLLSMVISRVLPLWRFKDMIDETIGVSIYERPHSNEPVPLYDDALRAKSRNRFPILHATWDLMDDIRPRHEDERRLVGKGEFISEEIRGMVEEGLSSLMH